MPPPQRQQHSQQQSSGNNKNNNSKRVMATTTTPPPTTSTIPSSFYSKSMILGGLLLLVTILYFVDTITKSIVLMQTSYKSCIDIDNHPLLDIPLIRSQPQQSPSSSSSSSTKSTFYNSPARFIFFIGLEGTGHHLLKGIVSQSPSVDRLRQLQIHYDLTIPLQESLHHEKYKNGLFNVHCQTNEKKINTTETFNRVVTVLQQINTKAKTGEDRQLPDGNAPRHVDDRGYTHPSRIMSIPINTLQASSSSGEMSYPNYHGDCRKLNYPNLDLFYKACEEAQVDCAHVYIYRNPFSILKSTTVNRDHNSNQKLAAIHLYTSLQNVISNQLHDYADKTVGCMGMLDGDTEGNNWWETMRQLFGWKNSTSYEISTKNKFYKSKTPMSDIEKAQLVSIEYQSYMDSWIRVHERTIRLCHDQFDTNQKSSPLFNVYNNDE